MRALPETPLERIRARLVGMKMSRALEVLDDCVRRVEDGQLSALEFLDEPLGEERATRETRRIKSCLMTARPARIKTLEGFDFSFQPSLDKNRILALAEPGFIDRGEVIHLLGPPGTGKSHLGAAIGLALIENGFRVLYARTTDLVQKLQVARRELMLEAAIRKLNKYRLLILDDIAYV